MYLITNCSPQGVEAISKHKPARDYKRERGYPFMELQVGQSFTVPISSTGPNSLRSLCATAGTVLRRSFKMLQHPDLDLLEVVRLE